MRLRSAQRLKRRLDTMDSFVLSRAYFQAWWVVEKCVESPESSRVFCDVVGVSRSKIKDLESPYRQTRVTVLTTSAQAHGGIALNWHPQHAGGFRYLKLTPIDYQHEVFPGWD